MAKATVNAATGLEHMQLPFLALFIPQQRKYGSPGSDQYWIIPLDGRMQRVRVLYALMQNFVTPPICLFCVAETPFGQLPILEFDGQVLCQSLTIARYLARKFSKCACSLSIGVDLTRMLGGRIAGLTIKVLL